MDDRRRYFLDALTEIQKLPEDWDSYGSPSIGKPALTRASEYISNLYWSDNLAYLSRVYPLHNGGISFEFRRGKRGLIITFTERGTVDGYMAFIDDDKIGKPDMMSIEEDFEEGQPNGANAFNYFYGLIEWVNNG